MFTPSSMETHLGKSPSNVKEYLCCTFVLLCTEVF
jgi:hypothetical protein